MRFVQVLVVRAQVNGRNHCKFSKKFQYDVWYVDHCSLMIDIKIIWMTIVNVLKREDVGEGASDMEAIDLLVLWRSYANFKTKNNFSEKKS